MGNSAMNSKGGPALSAVGRRLVELPKRISGVDAEEGVISFDRGDPGFPTPAPIVEAAARAMREGHTHYGNLNGDPELRAHIAGAITMESGSEVDIGQIVITAGSTAGLSTVLTALVDPGDRVVLTDPTYAAYTEEIAMVGGTPVRVPFLPDGHLDLPALHRAASGAKLIILCHPASPTGVVFTRDELNGLGDIASDTGTVVLADEAYADMVYDGREFVPTHTIPSLRPKLIVSRTFTKTYAMAGWRIGYLVVPPDFSEAVNLVHRTFNLVVNAAVQRGALAALRAGPELYAPMMRAYEERREMVMEWMRDSGLLTARRPEATFYVFAHYPHDLGSVEMAEHLLGYGVRVRPGLYEGPNGQQHLRICFASPTPILAEGLVRLEKGLLAL
ncbi:pyridoxal phosphate-dependent aminotransferase [Streptomyces sp. NPDC051014]|uniref:pyridoxal phosphate-dependent aminotransferase n=1 Tax=Streptomyces sp. NPDC051014 TaxID=3155751 RepID=UPI0033E175A4